MEVWFDQNELVGGDAWDAKIRKQIAECALFVPVISAATQARLEGYFRLEWKLAAQRTHTMADEKVFLLPVVIDGTRDAEAKVPAEFKSVQWTRLPAGEDAALEKFCGRVVKVLGGPEVARAFEPGNTEDPGWKARATSRRRVWIVAGCLAAVIVAVLASLLVRRSVPPAPPAVALTPARELAQKARALFEALAYSREDLALAEDLCRQALAAAPNDAEVLAIASQLNSEFHGSNWDRAPVRLATARSQAERALKLSPDSTEAWFAKSAYLRRQESAAAFSEAEEILRRLVRLSPGDYRVPLAISKVIAQRLAEGRPSSDEELRAVLGWLDQAERLPGGRLHALNMRALFLFRARRYSEAEAVDDAILAEVRSGSSYGRKVLSAFYQDNYDRARSLVDQIPPDFLVTDEGAILAAVIYLLHGETDRSLATLRPLTADYVRTYLFSGPVALLRGLSHLESSRRVAAETEWRVSLDITERAMGAGDRSPRVLMQHAYLLAQLGRREQAEHALKSFIETVTAAKLNPSQGVAGILIALGRVDEVVTEAMELADRQPANRRSLLRWLQTDPLLLPLRRHPRYAELLGRLTPGAESPVPPASSK